jgi:hypothetical protein
MIRGHRPYNSLFTGSPHMQAFAMFRKEDTSYYILRVSEYDPDTLRMEPKLRTIQGHWDAARWAVEHTTKTRNLVTCYEASNPEEPIWRTDLRPKGAIIGAYGASEARVTGKRYRARRADVERVKAVADDLRFRPLTEPPPTPVYTREQKRAAIEHLLTPRLVTVEDTQQAKTQARTISKEEKAQIIADLFTPRLT